MNERVKEKTARVGRENDEIDIMWAKQELRFYEEWVNILPGMQPSSLFFMPSEGKWEGAIIFTPLYC